MSELAQKAIVPTIADPENVRETYCNGPINFNLMGPCATLTFTNVRGDITQLMKGEQVTNASAVVVARITIPLEIAAELKSLLNRMIQTQPLAQGSIRTQ